MTKTVEIAVENADIRGRIVSFIWMGVVIIWPVLQWVVALDVVYQGLCNGSLMFLLHFGFLCALTYFVAFYTPKGIN